MLMKFLNKTPKAKREKQTRYLSQAIQLEEAVNPHIIRSTMSIVSVALLAFFVWAGFTNINEVARTPGEVVPFGHQQNVQHLEGGIVKRIYVSEGEVVKFGQPLLALDEAILQEDFERLQSKAINLAMQEERLRAFLDGRKPDFQKFPEVLPSMIDDQVRFFDGMLEAREKEQGIIAVQRDERMQRIHSLNAEIETAEGNLKIAKDIYERRRKLNAQGYATDMQLLQDEREVNKTRGEIKRLQNQLLVAQSEVKEYEDRLSSLTATHRDKALEKLSANAAEQAENEELIQKLEERLGRLQIRAPANGLVKGLAVNTIGEVVQPGETLMEVVPLDKDLEVSVKISPQDIGHLKIGQDVQVKFSTFDFSRYGFVTGKLEHVSATTFDGEQGERYYQGRVVLDQNYVGHNPDNKIMPGMTVMADVITGEKTILQYMLKPIHVSLKTAFSER